MDGRELIEKRIEELKTFFTETQNKITETANKYNSEITKVRNESDKKVQELLDEGETKINKLAEQREQFRGAYIELYYILHPEQRKQDAKLAEKQEAAETASGYMETEVSPATVDLGSVTVSSVEENVTDTKDTPVEPAEETNLTEEEIKQIEQTVEQTTTDVNEDDIPEYLREEYKK